MVVNYNSHVGVGGNHIINSRDRAVYQGNFVKVLQIVLLHLAEINPEKVYESLVLLMPYPSMVENACFNTEAFCNFL